MFSRLDPSSTRRKEHPRNIQGTSKELGMRILFRELSAKAFNILPHSSFALIWSFRYQLWPSAYIHCNVCQCKGSCETQPSFLDSCPAWLFNILGSLPKGRFGIPRGWGWNLNPSTRLRIEPKVDHHGRSNTVKPCAQVGRDSLMLRIRLTFYPLLHYLYFHFCRCSIQIAWTDSWSKGLRLCHDTEKSVRVK